MRTRSILLAPVVAGALVLSSCGGDDGDTAAEPAATLAGEPDDGPAGAADASAGATSGIEVVSPDDAAAIVADPPAELVILDVRTPEEFAEGHIDGAIQIDFYAPDFADRIAELDRDVPYLVYCRSGNRSGQTRALMAELGFASVRDVDGGIVSWIDTGNPVTN